MTSSILVYLLTSLLLTEVSHLLMLNNEHEFTELHESQGQFFQKSQATERISRIFLLLPSTAQY